MYELFRFIFIHIWQVQKGEPKNGLGELLELLILTTLHFGKDLSLLHSAKCSVSTQLTYIQKIIQFNKAAISTIKVLQNNILKCTKIHFLHLELSFCNSRIFCNFLEFLVSWISCHFGFFTTFGTNLQIFTKPI